MPSQQLDCSEITETADSIGNLSLESSCDAIASTKITSKGYIDRAIEKFKEECQAEYDRIIQSASEEVSACIYQEACCLYHTAVPPPGRSSPNRFTGVLSQTHYLDSTENTWKLYEPNPNSNPELTDTTVSA